MVQFILHCKKKEYSNASLIRDKKKVLMIGPHESVKGGIRTVVDNYLKWDAWNNVEIIYISTFIEKHYLVKIQFFLWNFLKIFFACIFGEMDIVHLHVSERGSFYRKALVLLLCRMINIKTILHHHGAEFMEFYSASRDIEKRFIKNILMKADLNLVLSEYQKRQMESAFPGISLRVLYNAVDGYKENNYNSNAKGILFLGRLCKRKGVYDFLEAFAECERIIDKDIKLYLCGDGEIDNVKNVVKKLKLKNRIAFTGWCPKNKLQEIYKKTMLYILPSYHEGLPMSLLETMSYGIPCIASDVAAIPEVIHDGENGILISPGEIEQIKNALLRLSASEDRVRLGNNGYETVNVFFLLRKKMAELEEIYDEITCFERG